MPRGNYRRHRALSPTLLPISLAILFTVLSGPSSASATPTSRNVTLLSHLDSYAGYSACWSYVHHDGREYAILGTTTGTSIVRLTDPANPVEVSFISGPPSDWREMKQYRNWVYVCSEGAGTGRGIQVISMENPDDPRLVKTYKTGFDTAHTVTIDTTRAILYCNGTSIGMVALSLANPESPSELGVFSGWYVHDLHVRGTLGYAAAIQDGFEAILDLSNPAAMTEVRRWFTPATFTHNSWTTEDGRYLFVTEENAGGKPKVYDIQGPGTPILKYTFSDLTAHIGHNVHIKGNTAFISYYTAGIRLYDISDPERPVEYAYYDTFQGQDGGFDGVWAVAPYYPSGIFICSDISNGLFVFQTNGEYAILRGTARQSAGGTPIPGVTVHDHASEIETKTRSDGSFDLALTVTPDGEIEASKFGYQGATLEQNVANGGSYTHEFVMPLLPNGLLRGTTRRASDNATLSFSPVVLLDTPLTAQSGTSGLYNFAGTPVGVYRVQCNRPGYLPAFRWGTVAAGQTTDVDFSLVAATFYDDAEIDRGWTLGAPGDNAVTGQWIRAIPAGTSTGRMAPAAPLPPRSHGVPTLAGQHLEPVEGTGAPGDVQPFDDNTPFPGDQCFVTGNGTTGQIGEADVDGGITTLTSPILNLAGVTDPRVAYWRWYSNNSGSGAGEDPFITQISNNGGSTWSTLDSLYETRNFWEPIEIRVLDHFPTPGDFRIRFIAQDLGAGSVVEAAVDDLMWYSGSLVTAVDPTPVPASPGVLVSAPWPTPTSGRTEVSLSLARGSIVKAQLFDVRGRMVRRLFTGILDAGSHSIRWDGRLANGEAAGSGVYWIRVQAAGAEKTVKVIVAR